MHLSQIVKLLVGDLEERLKERDMTIELTEEALNFMVHEGYDPKYGARPLKRYIQRHLETLLGRTIIKRRNNICNTIRCRRE